MAKNTVTLGLVQMRMGESPKENLEHALSMISDAAKKGAEIVCLPELFSAPYFAQGEHEEKEAEKFAEKIPGVTTAALSACAKENHITLIGGSVYERDGGKFYNTAAVFGSNGQLLGKYRKMHVPYDECYYEKNYFEGGNLGFKVFGIGKAKVAPLICYDQWFPEAARSVALMGADIVMYPTAIGTVKGIEQAEGNWQVAWENVMRGHAIANGFIVAAVNRCGIEGKMDFWGGSFVCDAFGKTIARAGKGEQVLLAKVDLNHSKMVREGWGFLQNRRPDQYGIITKKG